MLLVLLLAARPTAAAQDPPHVGLGFGVDTAVAAWSEAGWHAAVPEIFRTWRAYLQSDPRAQQPTPYWSAADQAAWPMYDLTSGIAYHGLPATVLDIRPIDPGVPDTFVVRTLFAAAGERREVRPVALTRVLAVREDGRWVFTNALHRLTRDWHRERVGPIRYVVERGRVLDRERAERGVAFMDSLAAAFGVPPVEALTYYVASSPEAVHRIMGVDWTFGGMGHGYALPANDLLFSGDAAFGEANRHELAHIVLAPLTADGRTHGLVSEGLPTWLGGSAGREFPALVREYAAYLRAHPEVTLDSILEAYDPDRGWNPAGAVLVLMVHEAGGPDAVRALFGAGRSHDELRAAVSRLLGMRWPDVAQAWRRRVLELGRP